MGRGLGNGTTIALLVLANGVLGCWANLHFLPRSRKRVRKTGDLSPRQSSALSIPRSVDPRSIFAAVIRTLRYPNGLFVVSASPRRPGYFSCGRGVYRP